MAMVAHYLQALRSVADFVALQKRFANIGGYLADLEGYALLQLAAHGNGLGAIVELGSFLGRSTAFLAEGTRATGREKVVAVDHFRGSPEHQPGGSHAAPALLQAGTTLVQFHENLRGVGLESYVTTVVLASMNAGHKRRGAGSRD